MPCSRHSRKAETMGETTRREVLRYLGGAAGLFGLGAIVPACGSDGSQAGGDLIATMKDRGHAVLGLVDSPPGSMMKGGKLEGSNIDIVKSVLRKHGVTRFKPFLADFPGMVSGLIAKRMDVCCAGLLITDERCQAIGLSDPVNVLIYAMAVKANNPKQIRSIADVGKRNAKLAIESATTQERVARGILPGKRIITVSGRQDGVDAVRVGRADAYLAPVDDLKQVVRNRESLFTVVTTVPDMPSIGSCIAFRKEDKAFLETFNNDFAAMKKSGEYAQIMERYREDPKRIDLKGIRSKC